MGLDVTDELAASIDGELGSDRIVTSSLALIPQTRTQEERADTITRRLVPMCRRTKSVQIRKRNRRVVLAHSLFSCFNCYYYTLYKQRSQALFCLDSTSCFGYTYTLLWPSNQDPLPLDRTVSAS